MENLQEILEKRNIKKLIYVDDELGKSSYYDNINGKIHSLIEEGQVTLKYPFLESIEIWEEKFKEWWQDASFEDIVQLASTLQISRTNSIIAEKLITICPADFPIELLAPEQFNDDYKNALIRELSKSQKYAIVLIDYDLKNNPVNGDKMFETISENDYLYCGIFSQTFEITEEISQWKERSFNPTIYPISKKRFEEEPSDAKIAQGLKNVIWLKQIESIKEMANKLVDKASETLKNGLTEIDPATFDRLIISNSMDEGCWEFDLLSRIMQVYLNRGIKNEMQNMFADFQEKTKSIRNFHDNTQTEFVNDILLSSFAKEEYYDNIDYINSIFCAISNGDIFLIKGKYFILLSQPCNLSIREDGRRSYDLDQAFLVPLYGNEKHFGAFCEKLQYPFNEKYSQVSFVNRQRVSLSMLDLVSYNKNGEAIIDTNVSSEDIPGHEIMQDNLLKRYNKIKEKVLDFQQTRELALNGRIDKNTTDRLAKYFCKPFEMGDSLIVKQPTTQGSIITFDVKRIGRYNSYGAHVLLQQFMNYMSRPEFPAKFDRC